MPSRKLLRLPGFDYSRPRLYFVTICAGRRGPVFGSVVIGDDGAPAVVLNALGRQVTAAVVALPGHGGAVVVALLVMPDHLHLVVCLAEEGPSLGVVIGGLKAGVARRTRTAGLWQRGYHDRVVRDERELENICAYIDTNPSRWVAARGVGGR